MRISDWSSDVCSSDLLEHEEMLVRLVALNDERAEEERAGQIRWVRPSFQAKSLRKKPAQVVLQLRRGTKAKKVERDWPSALPEKVVAVDRKSTRLNSSH